MNNYEDYVKRLNNKVYYFIPENSITTNDTGYIDYVTSYKVSGGYLVSSDQFSRRLRKLCNMSQQDYFDKFILGISDPNDRPKCSNVGCNNYIKWSNRITSGYGSSGHSWIESNYHFCCRKCEAEFKSKNPEAYSRLNEFIKSGGAFGMIHRNVDKYGLNGLKDPEIYHKTQMNKFINSGNSDDICNLYIVNTTDNKIKFGIASNLETRMVFGKTFNKYNEVLFKYESDRIHIAGLEFKIKSELGFPKTEYVDVSLLDKILNIIKSSTTISEESTPKQVEKRGID